MPSVPSVICQSISLRKASKSRLPSSCIGVTIATMLPVSCAILLIFLKIRLKSTKVNRGFYRIRASPEQPSDWPPASRFKCLHRKGRKRDAQAADEKLSPLTRIQAGEKILGFDGIERRFLRVR